MGVHSQVSGDHTEASVIVRYKHIDIQCTKSLCFNSSLSFVHQVTKLIDLLVALTISEEEMYPLIQAHVWAKIGREKDLLRRVLASFIRMGITNGLGSRKVEVLADTVVTLEQGTEGVVATEVIKKLLKVCTYVCKGKLWRVSTIFEQCPPQHTVTCFSVLVVFKWKELKSLMWLIAPPKSCPPPLYLKRAWEEDSYVQCIFDVHTSGGLP